MNQLYAGIKNSSFIFNEQVEDCGQCDNCLYPPKLINGTEKAKKVILAIQDTGSYFFGMHHIIDILIGNKTQRFLIEIIIT